MCDIRVKDGMSFDAVEDDDDILIEEVEAGVSLNFGDHVQVKYDIDMNWRNALFICYEPDNGNFIYRCITAGERNCVNYMLCRKANW